MRKTSKCNCSTARWLLLGLALLVLGIATALAMPGASLIVQHGLSLSKGCISPSALGATTDCSIRATNVDSAGDAIELEEAFDVIKPATVAVRVPATGNLPISAVSGNTTCTVGGSLPCLVKAACAACGPGGTPLAVGAVTFSSNAYVILATDPDPLLDQGNVNWRDTCSSGATGCDSVTINLAQAPGATLLTCAPCTPPNDCQTAACNETTNTCVNTLKPDSMPCTDTDRIACTIAGCEAGTRIQTEAVSSACNAACADGKTTAVVGTSTVNCVDALDCFNNSRQFDPKTGSCREGGPDNCHEQLLVN